MKNKTKGNIYYFLILMGIILFTNGVHMHNFYMQSSAIILFGISAWLIINVIKD